jgi:hypothetical protein
MINFPGLLAAALAIGLAFTPTLAHAEEDAAEKSGTGSESDGSSAKPETLMEKLEDAFKETTTPTDKEIDPIGTAEDADRDLY